MRNQYWLCAPTLPFQRSAPVGMAKLWAGKPNQGANLAEKQHDKIFNFCYSGWISFRFVLRAEPQTTVLAPLRAQDRTQLTPVSFILSTAIQMLLHRTGTLKIVPVRVIRVFGITDVRMAVADTPPSNADVFDAVVILESTRKVGY